jgi:hypothetical protein
VLGEATLLGTVPRLAGRVDGPVFTVLVDYRGDGRIASRSTWEVRCRGLVEPSGSGSMVTLDFIVPSQRFISCFFVGAWIFLLQFALAMLALLVGGAEVAGPAWVVPIALGGIVLGLVLLPRWGSGRVRREQEMLYGAVTSALDVPPEAA